MDLCSDACAEFHNMALMISWIGSREAFGL